MKKNIIPRTTKTKLIFLYFLLKINPRIPNADESKGDNVLVNPITYHTERIVGFENIANRNDPGVGLPSENITTTQKKNGTTKQTKAIMTAPKNTFEAGLDFGMSRDMDFSFTICGLSISNVEHLMEELVEIYNTLYAFHLFRYFFPKRPLASNNSLRSVASSEMSL